jgi:hypothetical protein
MYFAGRRGKLTPALGGGEGFITYDGKILKNTGGCNYTYVLKNGNIVTMDGIDQIEGGTVINVEFKFTCSLFPSVYFLNNGVLGVIDEEEVYLHRCVDALMFRVQPETDLLGTSLVDFQVESNLSELKKSNKLRA